MSDPPREVVWIGRAEKEFLRFPAAVRHRMNLSLKRAQSGHRYVPGAKPLANGILQGLGIVEVIVDFRGDTYRVVYTMRFNAVLAVLHAFQKKSTRGIATPQHEIRLIRNRYRIAKQLHGDNPKRRRRG